MEQTRVKELSKGEYFLEMNTNFGATPIIKSYVVYDSVKKHYNIEKEELNQLMDKYDIKFCGSKKVITEFKEELDALITMKKLVK